MGRPKGFPNQTDDPTHIHSCNSDTAFRGFSVAMGGISGPVYVDEGADVEALARAHVEQGYKSAYCPPVSLDDPDGIKRAEEAFKKAGVVIAELGAWRNIIPADSDKHEKAIAFASQQLALADAVGAMCCVTFAGTREYSDKAWGPPL